MTMSESGSGISLTTSTSGVVITPDVGGISATSLYRQNYIDIPHDTVTHDTLRTTEYCIMPSNITDQLVSLTPLSIIIMI